MRPGPDPEMHLRVLNYRPQLGIIDLLRIQHNPIRQIPRRQGLIFPPEVALPTARPQPVSGNDQITRVATPRDSRDSRRGEINPPDFLVHVEGHAQLLCAREKRLLQVDAVQIHKRRWVFLSDTLVETLLVR